MDTYTKLFPDSDDPAKLAEAEKLLLAERDIDATCGEIHKQYQRKTSDFESGNQEFESLRARHLVTANLSDN